MLESKLRNAARRAAVKFFLCNVDCNNMGTIVADFEEALATADEDATGGSLQIPGHGIEVWQRFEDCSVSDLYDYYHFLVEDFVKEALSDL